MTGKRMGRLEVTIVEARNLANEDLSIIGKNDAYAIIKVNNHKERTRTIENAGSRAKCDIQDDSEVKVEVWDLDTIKDDLIGGTSIPVGGLVSDGLTESWYPIGRGSKHRGEVLLRIRHHF